MAHVILDLWRTCSSNGHLIIPHILTDKMVAPKRDCIRQTNVTSGHLLFKTTLQRVNGEPIKVLFPEVWTQTVHGLSVWGGQSNCCDYVLEIPGLTFPFL